MWPFNQHGNLGSKMAPIAAPLKNHRDTMRKHIAIVHCKLGNVLLPNCGKCELYNDFSRSWFIFLLYSYDSSMLNESRGAAGTSSQNANEFMHGWMNWVYKF